MRHMRLAALVIAVIALFLQPAGASAEQLCPPRPSKGDPLAELVVKEGDFTMEAATKAIRSLREDLPKQFDGSCSSDQSCFNGYEIVYYNAIKTLEGTLLVQQAYLAQARDRLKSVPDSKVNEGQASFEQARKRLCDFLSSEYYAD